MYLCSAFWLFVFGDTCCLRISLFIHYLLDTNLIQLWSLSVVKTYPYSEVPQHSVGKQSRDEQEPCVCTGLIYTSFINDPNPRGWSQPLTCTWACVFDSSVIIPQSLGSNQGTESLLKIVLLPSGLGLRVHNTSADDIEAQSLPSPTHLHPEPSAARSTPRGTACKGRAGHPQTAKLQGRISVR